MFVTNGLQPANKIDLTDFLAVRHQTLYQFVANLLVDFSEKEHLLSYFEERSQYPAAARQDLLPLIVYEVVSREPYEDAIPVTAAWALHLAAAHLLDKAQDNRNGVRCADSLPNQVSSAVVALGAANTALAKQEVGSHQLPEILAVTGEVTINGTSAQHDELIRGRGWSKQDYFYNIASKSASIIAAGIWMGAVLTVEDEQVLMMLQEFGLALGMTMQIADDCLDLAEDLANGTYTLPVIEALALTDHPEHADLEQLLSRHRLLKDDVDTVMATIGRMGVIPACRRVARAYQVQAAAALTAFPDLAPFFSDYVTVEA